MRRISIFAGVVALIVGLAGLVAPVSVSPDQQVVRCGSAISPDLSAARSHDDRSAANVPVAGEVVVDTNYTRLCRMDLEDRRLWTITLAAVGVLAVAGAVVHGLLSRRSARSQ